MSRKPSVRYWSSRKGYWTTIIGVQHRLADGPDDKPDGPTFKAAQQAYWSLLELGRVPLAKDRATVRAFLETYMQHAEGRLQPDTFQHRLRHLRIFVDAFGDTAVGDVTHFMLQEFAATLRRRPKRPWRDGTIRLLFAGLSAAFRWGVKSGLLTANPVAGLDRPAERSRARVCLVTPELHAQLLAAIPRSQALRDLIVCLHGTGCRPGELAAATASAWDEQRQALVYYADAARQEGEHRHKTAGRGKTRVIPFRGEALTTIRRLLAARPTGPLFRTSMGRRWNTKKVGIAFWRLRKKIEVRGLTAYSYRHTYATNWLLAGKPIDVLAAVLGNTPEVIRRHYSHLLGDWSAVEKYLPM